MFKDVFKYIRELYNTEEFIPLHAPVFMGNERKYVMDAIDSTFVSSTGPYVSEFEKLFAEKIGVKYAIAVVNGTCALHMSLLLSGVIEDSEVLTQPLTFVATCNAISYLNAIPHFIDVDEDTLGLSPVSLRKRLEEIAEIKNGKCYNKETKKVISACVPMHTFGHACKIDEIVDICNEYHIPVVEDAAEALGSSYKGKKLGTYGLVSAFSFNGNKIITAGGGGVIVTNNEFIAKKAKHLTTTAKLPHQYEYIHDEIGYNYRMPNLNAALLVGQLENLDFFLENKKKISTKYQDFFKENLIEYIVAPENANSNYWLMAVKMSSEKEKNNFLKESNDKGIMTRSVWKLMNSLEMYRSCPKTDLSNAIFLGERIINIPSSIIIDI